jgi:hypothetical protein
VRAAAEHDSAVCSLEQARKCARGTLALTGADQRSQSWVQEWKSPSGGRSANAGRCQPPSSACTSVRRNRSCSIQHGRLHLRWSKPTSRGIP